MKNSDDSNRQMQIKGSIPVLAVEKKRQNASYLLVPFIFAFTLYDLPVIKLSVL